MMPVIPMTLKLYHAKIYFLPSTGNQNEWYTYASLYFHTFPKRRLCYGQLWHKVLNLI